jgi:hypothetical protein
MKFFKDLMEYVELFFGILSRNIGISSQLLFGICVALLGGGVTILLLNYILPGEKNQITVGKILIKNKKLVFVNLKIISVFSLAIVMAIYFL